MRADRMYASKIWLHRTNRNSISIGLHSILSMSIWPLFATILVTPNAINATNENSKHNTSQGHSNSEMECDFGGQLLPVAVVQQTPLVNCFQDVYGDWTCNGSNIEVINVLERQLNFKADWLVLSNRQLDLSLTSRTKRASRTLFCDPIASNRSADEVKRQVSKQQASNYTGVLGLVASGRACLSANGIMRTKERERDFILSEPFDSFRLHLLLSKWVRDHDHIFMKPFNANTWLAILSAAFAMVPIFYLINKTSSHYRLDVCKFLAELKAANYLRYLFVSRASKLFTWQPTDTVATTNDQRRKSSSHSFAHHLEKVASSGGSVIHHLMMHHQSSEQSPAVVKLLVKREQRLRRKTLRREWFLEWKSAKRARKKSQKSGFFNFAYVVWYVAGSLAGQGGETEDLPQASSTRILIAFWWLYLIVITSIHSGILTAILTFPKQNDFIQTLDDFLALETGTMRLAVERDSELAQLMSSPDNLHKSPLQTLLRDLPSAGERQQRFKQAAGFRHRPPPSPSAVNKQPIVQVDFQRHRQRLLDEVERGKCAYMEEKSVINLIITQEYFDHKPAECLFKSSRYPVDTIPMSLVLSDRLPQNCLQAINEHLRRIMRVGLAQKWRRKYEPAGNDCLNTVVINAGDVDKIQLRHVELAFWLLFAGLSLGLLFLLLEIVWLFTIDMEDDDEDDDEQIHDGSSSSSSSHSSLDLLLAAGSGESTTSSSDQSSTTSDDDEGPMLGHRRFLLGGPQRVLVARRGLRVERPPPLPTVHLSRHRLSSSSSVSLSQVTTKRSLVKADLPGQVKDDQAVPTSRRQRRAMRAAERRARLLRRTLQLARRLHEGKIYSDLFVKYSHKFQAGRAPLPAGKLHHTEGQLDGGPVRRRRQAAGHSKVAPLPFKRR